MACIEMCSLQIVDYDHIDNYVFVVQIERSLARASSAAGVPGGSPAPSLLIQQALEAIARISKGFNANLCTRVRPEIGEQIFSVSSLQR